MIVIGWTCLCVFLKFLPIQLQRMTTSASITKAHNRGHEPINSSLGIHQNVWLTESSCAPVLWHHHWDFNHQNKLFLLIFQGQLGMLLGRKSDIKTKCNVTKSMLLWRGRSKDSWRVRFSFVKVLYFRIKLQSPKVQFYHILVTFPYIEKPLSIVSI